jgi:zinc transporter ZupT
MTRPLLTDSQKRFRRRSMIASLAAAAILLAAAIAAEPLLPSRPLSISDVLCVFAALGLLQIGLVMAYVHAVQPRDAPMPGARLSQVINPALCAVRCCCRSWVSALSHRA